MLDFDYICERKFAKIIDFKSAKDYSENVSGYIIGGIYE